MTEGNKMRITFIQPDGKEQVVQGKPGQSIMRCAIENNILGIPGECGGAMACATCHGYIASPWAELLPPLSEMERAMLEGAIDPRSESRLTCQIAIEEALDGLVVAIPAVQS
jgi:2Fe-2S ferredoxin